MLNVHRSQAPGRSLKDVIGRAQGGGGGAYYEEGRLVLGPNGTCGLEEGVSTSLKALTYGSRGLENDRENFGVVFLVHRKSVHEI